jgi:hypothetical protein
MEQVKATCLAIEAGKTIVIDRESVIADADKAGITVIAIQSRADDGKN